MEGTFGHKLGLELRVANPWCRCDGESELKMEIPVESLLLSRKPGKGVFDRRRAAFGSDATISWKSNYSLFRQLRALLPKPSP